MIAFGGGGPVHAYRVAEKIGIDRIVVPVGAGVGSAIGFLRAPVAYEVVRSLYQRLSAFDAAAVNGLLAAMATEAHGVVAAGSFGRSVTERRLAFMRYAGQGHEIAVSLPTQPLDAGALAAIRSAYDTEYARLYDRPVPSSDVEILSYAVLVATVPDGLDRAPEVPSPASVTPHAWREVRDTASGTVSAWALFERGELPPGAVVTGPAIIAESETSTLVGPGWTATLDAESGISMLRATREAA